MGTLLVILLCIVAVVFIVMLFIPFFAVTGDEDFAKFLCMFVFFGLVCIVIIGVIAIFI